MKDEKHLTQESTPVPENNPFINQDYIGDPDKLLKQVLPRFEIYKQGLTIRQPFIYESAAMFAGQQNMWWNPSTSSMQPVPVMDPSRSTAINNRILNKCRAVVQRLVSFDPTSQCVPSGPSSGDVYAARMAKKIVESNHHDVKLNYRGEYEKFAEFVVIQGMGWLRTEWDPYGGRCSVTYKEQPVWQEIVEEAEAEGEGNYAELGEYLDNPMEEADENKEKTDSPDGENAGENLQDEGNGPDIEGTETGTPMAGGSEEPGLDEQGETQETPGEGGATGGAVKQKVRRSRYVQKLDGEGQPLYEPVRDENGKPIIDKIEFDGCVVKKAIGPLSVYYNPVITDWNEAFDCFEVEYLSLDEVKNKYPSCSDLTENDYEKNDANPWMTLLQNNIGKSPLGQNRGISVKHYYAKSTPDFPRGLKLTIIKDKIRVGIPMPTLSGDVLPYDFAGYIHLPGTFWYMSLALYLKNPQLILNKTLRSYLDHMNQFAVPKVLKRSDVRFSNTMTNGVEIISWEGSAAPTFENPQSTSGAHMEMIKYMDDTMDTNSGVNKTAEGNPPPNVTSGDMAEAVTENDFQLHMLDIDRVAFAITGSCNKEIRYVRDNASPEILARFIGPGGRWTVEKFKKSNLRNISDVMFIPGKAANLSRGQERKDIELMLPIVTQGAGTPEQQKKIIDKATQFLMFGEEEALESYINQQEKCILDILGEMEANVNNPQYDATKRMMPWHDLKVWLEVIEEQLLDYTDFIQKPEITKQRLTTLWETVHNRLQANMAPPPGAPPVGPAGPQEAPPQGAPAPPQGVPG